MKKIKPRIPRPEDGRPDNGEAVLYDIDKPYWFTCCDCCATHLFIFSIENGKVVITSYRDDFETDRKRAESEQARG